MKPKIVIVAGITASGKTSLGIEVAKQFNGEIINFDSLVIYNELAISTAAPLIHEQQGIPHHLVRTHSVLAPLNAAKLKDLAIDAVEKVLAKSKVPILVGGSGFYLQAFTKGMYEDQGSSVQVTQKSQLLYDKEGINPFQRILKEVDPQSSQLYHPNDHYRIRRAVEYYWQNNIPFSIARQTHQPIPPPWEAFAIYLNIPSEEHYPIIQSRTHQMLADGMIEEIKRLFDQDPLIGELKPLQSIGPKETLQYLRAEIGSIEELSERISISTRQLAKSQRTWFKKQGFNEYHPEQQYQIFKDLQDFMK